MRAASYSEHCSVLRSRSDRFEETIQSRDDGFHASENGGSGSGMVFTSRWFTLACANRLLRLSKEEGRHFRCNPQKCEAGSTRLHQRQLCIMFDLKPLVPVEQPHASLLWRDGLGC